MKPEVFAQIRATHKYQTKVDTTTNQVVSLADRILNLPHAIAYVCLIPIDTY